MPDPKFCRDCRYADSAPITREGVVIGAAFYPAGVCHHPSAPSERLDLVTGDRIVSPLRSMEVLRSWLNPTTSSADHPEGCGPEGRWWKAVEGAAGRSASGEEIWECRGLSARVRHTDDPAVVELLHPVHSSNGSMDGVEPLKGRVSAENLMSTLLGPYCRGLHDDIEQAWRVAGGVRVVVNPGQ